MIKKNKSKKYCILLFAVASMAMLSSCDRMADSKIIAYLSGTQWNGGRIWLMHEDGTYKYELDTGLLDNGCPSWSPDGKKLLFISANGTGTGITQELLLYTINMDGSDLQQITNNQRNVYSASWSPDGTKIAYVATDSGHSLKNALYIVDVHGKVIKDYSSISKEYPHVQYPSWSPDGKRIIITSNKIQKERKDFMINTELYILDLASGDIQQVTQKAEDREKQDERGSWSPDAKYIVYESGDIWTGEPFEIFIINSDSHDVIYHSEPGNYWDYQPRWTPDGTKILFSSSREQEEGYNIYIMNISDYSIDRLTDTGYNYCPDMQP
jgi:TolB protein